MKTKIFILFITILFSFIKLNAQQDTTNLDELWEMSLEELMQLEVKIITKKALPIRETPAIITVISEEEIQNSGLRDLKEILELFVPGFQFGVDVEGAVGISVRGMWATEGKVLLMIDGLECNEEMFSNTFFINHYTVDNIKKVEISRGPGSAIYGGYAGLSVINIITKDHSDSYLSSSYSQMDKSYAQRYANFNVGKKHKDFSFTLNGAYSQGVKSQRDNIDYFGNEKTMNQNSDINTTFINTNIKYKGLNIRTITDLYHYQQIDLWGENSPILLDQHTDTYLYEISYDLKINDKHKLIPKFVYKYQEPWHLDVPSEEYVNSKFITKYYEGITHSWDIKPKINLLTGTEYFYSALNLPKNHKDYEETFNNNTNTLAVSNYSIYSQLIIINKIVNFTFGGRYDFSSEYGLSFVPRVAFTKIFRNLHFKAMLSQSFRTPGGIILNRIPQGVKGIEPEKATNYEFETGYSSGHFYFGINLFSVTFDKVIVYGSDPETGLGTYINSGMLGTNGLEAEIKYRQKYVNLMINYAYHYATKSDVAIYIVPTNDKYLLAFTPHRINSMINIKLHKNVIFNLVGEFYGKRYGYTYFDGNKDILTKFEPEILLNANFRFKQIFKTKLDASIGVSNILDAQLLYIQPYLGGHAPLPARSRTLDLKLLYKF